MKRTIRVFISSTFHDMQPERDFLIHKVFPKLKNYCISRDVLFSEIDLRWGITEEESENKKVTEICLREIDNTHPFLIGLLGDRYGWIPTKDDIDRNLIENYPWLEKDISSQLSLTEIEMRYGALRSAQKINAMFFIRSSQNTNHETDLEPDDKRKKLEQLKSDILAQKKYPVCCYADLDTLGTTLERQFIELINQLYPDKVLSEFEKAQQIQNTFINSRTNIYVTESILIEKLNEFVSGTNTKLVVTGKRGYGKSALLANWTINNINKEFHIIPYFIGTNLVEANPVHALDYLNETISQQFDFPELSFLREKDFRLADKKKKCEKALNILDSKGEKIILLIDAIDQLSVTESIEKIIWLPTADSSGNKIIVSIEENDPSLTNLLELGYLTLETFAMSISEKENCIRKILAMYGKKLTSQQTALIANCELCSSPLILTTLLNEIITFGIYEELDERISFYLSAESEKDFFHRVLIRLENIFGKSQTGCIFSVISESLRGLSAKEIQEIHDISQLEWSYFYFATKQFLIERNGLLNFYHNIFKETVKERYDCVRSKEDENGYYEGTGSDFIMSCFRNQLILGILPGKLKPKDSIDNYLHKAEELLYQLSNNLCDHIQEDPIKLLIDDYDIYSYLSTNNPLLLSDLMINIGVWANRDCYNDMDKYIKDESVRIKHKINKLHADAQLEEYIRRLHIYKNIDGHLSVYITLGKYALQLCRKKLQQNGNDWDVLRTYIDLLIEFGLFYFRYGQHQKAKYYFLKVIPLIEQIIKKDKEKHTEYLYKIHWFWGEYYCAGYKPKEAKKHFMKAKTIYQKQATGQYCAYLNYSGLLVSYARLEIVNGSVNRALKLLNESYQHLYNYVTDQYNEIRYFYLNNLCHLAYCYILQNNSMKTAELYQKILELYFPWTGNKHNDIFGNMVKTFSEIYLLSMTNPNAAVKKIKSMRKIDTRTYEEEYFQNEINERFWDIRKHTDATNT